MSLDKLIKEVEILIESRKGGSGSGNFGHGGVEGHRGGSAPKGMGGGFHDTSMQNTQTGYHQLQIVRQDLTKIASSVRPNYESLQQTRRDLTKIASGLASVNHPKAKNFEERIDKVRYNIFDNTTQNTPKEKLQKVATEVENEIDSVRYDIFNLRGE